MKIKAHFYLIILIIQKSVFSRLIWYLLLLLNTLVFVLLFEYNNRLVSKVSKYQHGNMEYGHLLKNLKMPIIIARLENIKRESFTDKIKDDFSSQLYNSMNMQERNRYSSNGISIRRRLRDVRPPGCSEKEYVLTNKTTPSSYFSSSNAYGRLPKVSVVVTFCNELLTLVLRTVWSILRHTDSNLVHEIILVDDGSNDTDIINVLPWYIENRLGDQNIKLIRNPTQKHIVGAKLVGARDARGEVLVFLEGHCEVTPGWLEPLLYHVHMNPNAIAIPILDYLEYETLEFIERNPQGLPLHVDFDWGGSFGYVVAKARNNNSNIDPIYSPVMTGGVFAINRDYFWKMGGYDPKIYGWGGENFELSFKTWLCGGRLDIIPCSHVAHLDRNAQHRPYANAINSNNVNFLRIAKIWMDEYKRLVYLLHENASIVGTIDEQLDLKKKLNCKTFSWYVKNIIPDKFKPDEDSEMYGRLRSGRDMEICVDNLLRVGSEIYSEVEDAFLGQYPCHPNLKYSQYFALSHRNELRGLFHCAELSKSAPFDKIRLRPCNGNLNQMWNWRDNREFQNIASGKCLTSPSILGESSQSKLTDLIAIECNGGLDQVWEFEFKTSVQLTPQSNTGIKIIESGRLRNERFKEMCIDDYSQKAPYLLSQYPCIGGNNSLVESTQNFSFTQSNELRHYSDCAEVFFCDGPFCGNQYRILMTTCNGSNEQKWKLTKWNGLRHLKTNSCLTSPSSHLASPNVGEFLLAIPCDNSHDQIWRFDL